MRSHRRVRFIARSAVFAAVIGGGMAVAVPALAVPVTQVSADPYTNTTSFHQTEVEPDTFSFGSTIVSVFQTGRFPDGGANDTGWATSVNDGASWTTGFMPGMTVSSTPPGPWARISDPTIAFDPLHGVWLAGGLALDDALVGRAVLVNRSADGGLTWSNPVTVAQGGAGSSYDKDWVACDTWAASPNFGNCYAQWDDANLGNRLMMARSTDGGLTWTPSAVPNASVIGGQPVALPNGRVVVPITGPNAESFVSTDGGQSYAGPFPIGSLVAHGAPGMRDGEGLVSAEVDAGGTVYVAWISCQFRPGCNGDDVVFSVSNDGQRWSAVRRIPVGAASGSQEAFLAGIGVDRTTAGQNAHLGVAFYQMPTTDCTPSTCKLQAWFVSSRNGGATWSSPLQLFGPFRETQLANAGGFFLGDYVSVSFASNGRAFPVLPTARATGDCTLGQITSCAENMVSPRSGVAALGGAHRSTSHGRHAVPAATRLPRTTAF
jgi:hypothetical protein